MSPSAPETTAAASPPTTPPTIRPRQVSITQAEGDYFGDPKEYNELKDGELRRRVVWPVMAFFAFANLLVYALIWVAFAQDTQLIESHLITANQRVVTSTTIGELIGGRPCSSVRSRWPSRARSFRAGAPPRIAESGSLPFRLSSGQDLRVVANWWHANG